MGFPTPPSNLDLPLWAYGAGAVLTEPSSTQMQTGWTAVPGQNYGQVPPYKWENWLKYSTGQWLSYAQQALGYLSSTGFTSINYQAIVNTGTTTYHPTHGLVFCIIEAVGGGGGGGSLFSATGNNAGVASGGGGGEYVKIFATSTTIGSSQSIFIGNAATPGNNGVNTTVGSLITAHGGKSGSGNHGPQGLNTVLAGGGGGSGTGQGFDFLDIPGQTGNSCFGFFTSSNSIYFGANGGSSFFASGGPGGIALLGGTSFGQNGYLGSGGGGGAFLQASSSGFQLSGNGGSGGVFITEFVSG
jgi:hypothetical protein